MELYSVESERIVIKEILQNPDFARTIFLNSSLTVDHFADLFHRDAYEAIADHFRTHFCAPPDEHVMANHLIPMITRAPEKYKDESAQRKIWMAGVRRLYIAQTAKDRDTINSHFEAVEQLYKMRSVQKFLVDAEQDFERGKPDKVLTSMKKVVMETISVGNRITEGEIVSSFKQHIQILKEKREGIHKPVRSWIIGAEESKDSGEAKTVRLDDMLDGGSYRGELTLLIGENNVGKSFVLMETAYACAYHGGNAAIVTIEMTKEKQDNRIYSRMTGIPYTKFKRGTLTRKDVDRWRERLIKWKRESGKLYVIGFDQGTTVPDIASKLQEVQMRLGIEFDLVAIDYLNDLQPVDQYKGGNKSWEAMGEISWALAQMAKWWNNRKGIPIITANQKKSGSAGRSRTEWQDAAYGTIVTQHATVGIGIGQSDEDKEIGRIVWDIWKMRDGGKGQKFYTYPDFSVSRVSSKTRMEEFYAELSAKDEAAAEDGDKE